MKRWAVPALLFLVLAAALLLRCGDLAGRPLHNDEAINAFKVRKLWTAGEFRYDPHEYHGPSLYFLTLPSLAAASVVKADPVDETTLRWVPVVFGVALILVLGLLARDLGWPVILWAGLFTAVSPVMVYYSRYYIHEMVLVFFTALTLASGWRYVRNPGRGWAAMVGAGAAMMYATKETFVFSVAALLGAWGIVRFWVGDTLEDDPRGSGGTDLGSRRKAWWAHWVRPWLTALRRHGVVAAGVGLAVFVVFFTSFFTNAQGPLDAFRTYWIWGERAGGASPHVYPWPYYLQRLAWFHWRGGPVWTELGVGLLACMGAWSILRPGVLSGPRRVLGAMLLAYTVLLTAIYAIIPYKTPWCLLGFYHGILILSGYGAWHLLKVGRRPWMRVILVLGLAGSAAHLTLQARRATGEFAADFRNPWVYGHTSADVVNLLEQVTAISAVHPEGLKMPMQVMAPGSGYWPLPWYWRNRERVGWWDRVPDEPLAPVVVAASKLEAKLEEKTGKAWRMVGLFELRPHFFVELYVESGLWARFLEARAKEHAAEAAGG